ncbi:MAG: hypothetical protein GY856_40550 [bacterium]|nr:hypothetical protein [bacterium]
MVAPGALVYVMVDDGRFWKTAEVEAIIAEQRAQLEELLSAPLKTWEDPEF